MKLRINKKLKIILISFLIILIGSSSFLLYKEVKYPGFEEKKVPVYSYNNKSTINYKVFLKPNKLYDTNFLEEGKLYITEFVDYIQTNFKYEFCGKRISNLNGTYDILAKIQGFTIEKDEIKYIWEKNYVIIQQKSFSIKDNAKIINEEFKFGLDEYNNFVKEIIELSKINCQTQLNLMMNINLEGNIDKGLIKETISPNIIVPLNTNIFQISGNNNIEKPGVIEEIEQIQLPINKKQVIFHVVIIGILMILLILSIFFTEGIIVIKDKREKFIKEIFKRHGDRIVALNSELAINHNNCNKVKSIDDLVKIADEMCKPIMYKYNPYNNKIKMFYVIDENNIFILDIDGMFYNGELNTDDDNISDIPKFMWMNEKHI